MGCFRHWGLSRQSVTYEKNFELGSELWAFKGLMVQVLCSI